MSRVALGFACMETSRCGACFEIITWEHLANTEMLFAKVCNVLPEMCRKKIKQIRTIVRSRSEYFQKYRLHWIRWRRGEAIGQSNSNAFRILWFGEQRSIVLWSNFNIIAWYWKVHHVLEETERLGSCLAISADCVESGRKNICNCYFANSK